MRAQPADPDYEDDWGGDEPAVPSKTRRKREMHQLQALGEALVALPAERLARVPLPEELREAVQDARRFSSHGAHRRQLQYIGRLMRTVEAEPIRAALEGFAHQSAREAAAHQRLERLRARLLENDDALHDIKTQWPHADLQHLRTLARNARKEAAAAKPPRAARELFRQLRALMDAAAPAPGEEQNDE